MTQLCDEAGGNLIVGCRMVRACDGHAVVDGFVDLRPLRGTVIRLALKAVRQILGCDLPVVHKLIAAGVLEEDTAAAGVLKRYVLIDPSATFRGLYELWVASFEPPTDYAGWEMYKTVRRACRIGTDEPLEPHIERAATTFLSTIGINKHELRAIVECNTDTESVIVKNMRKSLRASRRAIAVGGPMEMDVFVAMLPDAIARAPQTCLDPINHDLYDPPKPEVLGRLAALGPMFEVGSLHVLLLAGQARRDKLVSDRLRAIERLDEMLTMHRPDACVTQPDVIGAALDRYVYARDLLPDDVHGAVIVTASLWHMIRRSLTNYVTRLGITDAALADELAKFIPAAHPASERFVGDLGLMENEWRAEGIARRYKRASDLVDDFDRVAEILRLRMLQLEPAADEAEAAVERLRAGSQDYEDFCADVPVLLADGMPGTAQQTLRFRCWRVSALHHRIAQDDSGAAPVHRASGRPRKGEARPGKSIRDLGQGLRDRIRGTIAGPDHYIEYLSEHSTDPDRNETATPWYVELLRKGAVIRPASLSVERREERRRLIREWSLPGYVGVPAGLLGFGRIGTLVARLCQERHAMTIIPLAEFAHAMRIAYLLFEIQISTACRPGEALQLCSPSSKDRWEAATGEGEILYAFKTFPKQHSRTQHGGEVLQERSYVVADDTLLRIVNLEKLELRRAPRADGRIATMPPLAPLAWKCGPSRFLFSHAGVPIDIASVNCFFRHLAAGVISIRAHDLRHVSAKLRRAAGTSIHEIGQDLNHADARSTRRYAEPTRQQQLTSRERMRRSRDRGHRRSASTALERSSRNDE